MLKILSDISLKNLNTFGIEVKARYFVEISSISELCQVLTGEDTRSFRKLILGGGSNILFTRDFDGIVIKINIGGIEKAAETDEQVWIEANAGLRWHDLVLYCLQRGYGGIENLSLIPGTVGAAPIQNIGAYGRELVDVFQSLEAVRTDDCQVRTFDKDECRFGYRHSIFKSDLKGKYVIASLTLRLEKQPVLNIAYGEIADALTAMGIEKPTIGDVSQAICRIRQAKLPDPECIGNAGSFFKNPEIDASRFERLKRQFPHIVGHTTGPGLVKVSAGRLIDHCGWKGKRIGDAAVFDRHALILVNHGRARGTDILELANRIQKSVQQKFGIILQPEVNIL